MSDDRLIILEALLLIGKEGNPGNQIIKDVLDKYSYLDRQHRSFIKRAFSGTLERKIELDMIIDQFSKTPTSKMKPVILCILEMSVYQLKYMDNVPESAVCNEAVKLAKKKGFVNLSGFVNGVLRNISRNLNKIKYPDPDKDKVGYLSSKYSMPEYLTRCFLDWYPENAEKILASFLAPKGTTIRINKSKTSITDVKAGLSEDGACIEELPAIEGLEHGEMGYLLSDYDRIDALKAFKRGDFLVQDLSAMQVIPMAGLKGNEVVMDVCAAPGGKACQAADMLCMSKCGNEIHTSELCQPNDLGRVLAFDVSDKKVALINEHIERCGYTNITAAVKDARVFDESYVNSADVILADLPCSGLGIIGRKSDIKYNVTKDSMESLVSLQREILTNVSKYLKCGGTLMYSTCTLNPEENEKQVKWILNNLPFDLECKKLILPDEYHDGFFIAKLKKNVHPKGDLRSLGYEDLKKVMEDLGESRFRADQIFGWMHAKYADTFDEMGNVSKSLKMKLNEKYEIYTVRPVKIMTSEIDGTKKFLFALHDGNIIESVLMRYEHGNSVCVSSQVGCNMGCRFCASTIDGKVRNLTAGEILGQIYGIAKETGEKISNVVVMGSGEPLDNYVNLIDFISILSYEKGMNLSQRNITVSTCGIVPKMRELADLKLQITLAISLHASNNDKRRELMPIAGRYSIEELIEACRYYFDKTGRRLTFEYSLVKGENDSDADAQELSALIRGLNCHVNLIPVNPIEERNYRSSDKTAVLGFKNKLEKNHINVTIRREMGRDIEGACGQLRRKYMADFQTDERGSKNA